MTDRELLELAAKASGLNLRYNEGKSRAYYAGSLHYMTGQGYTHSPWNPLNDDGDALRLAVKLSIDIKHYDEHVVAWFDGGYLGTGFIPYDDDPYAATRRAIVRAAAEIGGAMS